MEPMIEKNNIFICSYKILTYLSFHYVQSYRAYYCLSFNLQSHKQLIIIRNQLPLTICQQTSVND